MDILEASPFRDDQIPAVASCLDAKLGINSNVCGYGAFLGSVCGHD
jgi:hypothetical protein